MLTLDVEGAKAAEEATREAKIASFMINFLRCFKL